jgi:hypothetical protein
MGLDFEMWILRRAKVKISPMNNSRAELSAAGFLQTNVEKLRCPFGQLKPSFGGDFGWCAREDSNF